MFEMVVLSGGWTKVLWSVIGPNQVDVVNFVLSGDESIEDTVLIGLDLLVRPDVPSQDDVSVVPEVPTRFTFGHLLAGGKVPRSGTVAELSAGATEASLRGTLNGDSAGLTNNGVHHLILQVTALCHRTFSGVDLFDRHRKDVKGVGTCVDPATLLTKDDGNPTQVFRDGLWRSPKEFTSAGTLFGRVTA
jgi:hypothetical protein